MKTCFLFPGQGAQYPGMAKDLYDASPEVRELFSVASGTSGMDAQKLMFESTAEELKATDRTQIAVTLASLCSGWVLKGSGARMDGCAGFSLGEYAALCMAEVIALKDVFPIVKLRGELMEKAARGLDSSSGAAGMVAVLGIPAERVASVVEPLAKEGAHLANYNSPGQMVISGTADGLQRAEKALKDAGAKRLIRLAVSGPFHSPLMVEARKRFDEALKSYSFSDPKVPVYSNVTGRPIASGAEARELCGKQLVSLVRWVTVEERLLADGFDRFLEAGPGTVLAGLLRALRPDLTCAPAGTLEGIQKATGVAA